MKIKAFYFHFRLQTKISERLIFICVVVASILKLVFYTGVLIVLLVVTGNIGIAYLGTCVARLLIHMFFSEF